MDFRSVPDRFVPVYSLALGTALGFYPAALPPWLRLLLALLATALGLALLGLPTPGARLRALLVLAFGLGAGLGLGLSLDEGPAARFSRSLSSLEESRASAPAQRRLVPIGAAGRLRGDSVPARGGYRSYGLEASALSLEGPGIRGECSTAGRFRLLVREGALLEAGVAIQIRGRFLEPRPEAADDERVLFAQDAELALMDRGGGLAALRARARKACLGALSRAAGGSGVGGASPAQSGGKRIFTEPGLEQSQNERSEGLLLALLAGYRELLSQEDAAAFTQAGCAHVLALSGQHLAILAAALALLLRPLAGQRGAQCASLFLAGAYVAVVGPGPSLTRALLMYALTTAFALGNRPLAGRGALGLAFLLQLIPDPEAASSLGFQLSYLAVAGLVVLTPSFEHLLSPWLPPRLATAVAASLAAQAATAPLIAFQFGIFQPIGLFATLATALLVEALMYWGLGAALLCGLLPGAGPWVAPVTRLLASSLSRAMEFFAAVPALALPGAMARLGLSAAIVGLAAFVYARPYAAHRSLARSFRTERRPAGL